MKKQIAVKLYKGAFGNDDSYTEIMVDAYKYNAGDAAPVNRKALDSVADLCHECGKALGKNPLYFEVNTGWEIIVPGSDAENSQGCFPIGSTCANKFAPELLIKMGAK